MYYIHFIVEAILLGFVIIAFGEINKLRDKLDFKKLFNCPPPRPPYNDTHIWKETVDNRLRFMKEDIWKLTNKPKFKVTDHVMVTEVAWLSDNKKHQGESFIVSGVSVGYEYNDGVERIFWSHTLINENGTVGMVEENQIVKTN